MTITTNDGKMERLIVTAAKSPADAVQFATAVGTPFFVVRDITLIESE